MRDRELISIAAAARRLGFGDSTVKRMVLEGELPGLKLGRRWYVRNLTAFLDERQRTVAPRVVSEQERIARLTREEECRRLGIPVDHPFA
jgi:excisionase family DNA binding protein